VVDDILIILDLGHLFMLQVLTHGLVVLLIVFKGVSAEPSLAPMEMALLVSRHLLVLKD